MSPIRSIARFKIHLGKTEEDKRLLANCMDLVRAKTLAPSATTSS